MATEPKPAGDPWAGVPAATTTHIRGWFATPVALATAIGEHIQARLAGAGQANGSAPVAPITEVMQFLHRPETGFLPDGRACGIISAYIAEITCTARKEAMRIFGCRTNDAAGEIQANIITAFMKNPQLAAVTSWEQLKRLNGNANVAALIKMPHLAYQVRAVTDPVPVLLPSAPLVGVLNALNTGKLDGALRPEEIVPIKLWRTAYAAQAKGRDPFQGGKGSDRNYTLQL